MKNILIKFISILFAVLFTLSPTQPVLAHGDDARIEISAERLNPGSVLDLRGVGFEPETEVTLILAGSQVEVALGTVLADAEGLFLLTIPLPVDLAEGVYVIRATTEDNHSIDSPQLTIWGSPDLGSADGEPREEDDGLLAPMPTFGAAPTPMVSSAPMSEGSTQKESSTIPYTSIAIGVGIAILTVLILVLKKR